MRDTGLTGRQQDGDVVLGDDWVSPDQTVAAEMQVKRARRGFFSLKGSPLTRKIITFNLIALIILVAGILYLNSSRQSLVKQRAGALVAEVSLIADVFEAVLPSSGAVSLTTGDGIDVEQTLTALTLRGGVEAFVFDTSGVLVAQVTGVNRPDTLNSLNEGAKSRTLISDNLSALWSAIGSVFQSQPSETAQTQPMQDQLRQQAQQSLSGTAKINVVVDTSGGTIFSAVAPILSNGTAIGAVALAGLYRAEPGAGLDHCQSIG
jgi:two-component system sensor histidine kinase ChvG